MTLVKLSRLYPAWCWWIIIYDTATIHWGAGRFEGKQKLSVSQLAARLNFLFAAFSPRHPLLLPLRAHFNTRGGDVDGWDVLNLNVNSILSVCWSFKTAACFQFIVFFLSTFLSIDYTLNLSACIFCVETVMVSTGKLILALQINTWRAHLGIHFVCVCMMSPLQSQWRKWRRGGFDKSIR